MFKYLSKNKYKIYDAIFQSDRLRQLARAAHG